VKYKKVEEQLLKSLGMRRYVGSGRGMTVEDGTDGFWHVQLKVVFKGESYRLRAEDLAKLQKRAFLNGQIPLFAVFFSNSQVFVFLYPTSQPAVGENVVELNKVWTISPAKLPSVLQFRGIYWKVACVPLERGRKFLDAVKDSAARSVWK